jgi:AhpD family alkylhydroperoxidase
MKERLSLKRNAPAGYKAMLDLDTYLSGCGLEESLLHLVYLRASQINGCAFCNDMHWKDARHAGATEQKLSLVLCWRESPGFSDRERAALAWAEAVTNLSEGHVPDSVYESSKSCFTDAEFSNLTLAIAAINAWNRLGIAFRMTPGAYQPSN